MFAPVTAGDRWWRPAGLRCRRPHAGSPELSPTHTWVPAMCSGLWAHDTPAELISHTRICEKRGVSSASQLSYLQYAHTCKGWKCSCFRYWDCRWNVSRIAISRKVTKIETWLIYLSFESELLIFYSVPLFIVGYELQPWQVLTSHAQKRLCKKVDKVLIFS